jgi:AcrR family transcriptional regulator
VPCFTSTLPLPNLKKKLDETDWLVFNTIMNENYGRKKQPQIVRALLLDAAEQIAVEIGLGNLTLDLVAQRAGVSKGGLIHHFPSRTALIEGLFNHLLLGFEKSIKELIACDENKSGRFIRAYLRASVKNRETRENKWLGAFALAMSTDEALSQQWRDWLRKQMQQHDEDTNSAVGNMIRYAADGIWLEDCTGAGIIDSAKRESVVEYLIDLTYTI